MVTQTTDMPMDTAHLTSLPPGTVEFVQGADGSRLRVLHAGSGPTVVLAHGYLMDLTSYSLVFRELVHRGYRVIAFDQRGHGESRTGREGLAITAFTQDYADILEHFEVRDGQLVAHSMGSFLGLRFCMEYPAVVAARLRRLIVVGGTAGAVAQGSLPNRLQIPLLKSGLMEPLWKQPRLGRLLLAQIFGPGPDEAMIEATRQILLRQNVLAALPVLEAMIRENHYGRLGEIRLPTKVLCGTHDRTCPRWHSERLGREIPTAENTWLTNVGHMVPYESPQAVVEAVAG